MPLVPLNPQIGATIPGQNGPGSIYILCILTASHITGFVIDHRIFFLIFMCRVSSLFFFLCWYKDGGEMFHIYPSVL